MWRGIQSLCLLLYSEHVPSPLHLSVLSNNSPLLAACLPASLVNHAVFASDLARIVAGLYVYAVRLHKRTETFQCFWLTPLHSLSCRALTHSRFFPRLPSQCTPFSSAALYSQHLYLSLSLSHTHRRKPDIATATCECHRHTYTHGKPVTQQLRVEADEGLSEKLVKEPMNGEKRPIDGRGCVHNNPKQ